MEKTGSKIICGAPTTLAVKGLMMMMMNALLRNPESTKAAHAECAAKCSLSRWNNFQSPGSV